MSPRWRSVCAAASATEAVLLWRSQSPLRSRRLRVSFLRNITSGLRSLFRKEQVDRELDEELRAYQQMATEEKMKQGMSRKDALRGKPVSALPRLSTAPRASAPQERIAPLPHPHSGGTASGSGLHRAQPARQRKRALSPLAEPCQVLGEAWNPAGVRS